MANLLLVIKGNRIKNGSIFAHQLLIYDDLMVFKKRGLITRHEVTISYNHISQVYLTRGLIFSTIEIINTGGIESIFIKHVLNGQAYQAKKTIDKKIHYAHEKDKNRVEERGLEIQNLEASLNRLKELLNKGKITSREYNKKREKLLKQA